MQQISLEKLSLAVSVISLAVAVSAISYAVSLSREIRMEGPRQLQVPSAPKPLTADNPASSVPHAYGIHPVAGVVVSASDSTLVVNSGGNEQTPIRLDAKSNLYRQGMQKDSAEYQKEMNAFQDTLKNAMGSDEIFIAPLPYATTKASVSDFASGTNVMAFVGADGVAVQIVIMPDAQPAAR